MRPSISRDLGLWKFFFTSSFSLRCLRFPFRQNLRPSVASRLLSAPDPWRRLRGSGSPFFGRALCGILFSRFRTLDQGFFPLWLRTSGPGKARFCCSIVRQSFPGWKLLSCYTPFFFVDISKVFQTSSA